MDRLSSGADDDAVAKHDAPFSGTLSGHFSRRGCSSPNGLGVIGQLNPFLVPDIFIIEEVKIEPAHKQQNERRAPAPQQLKNKHLRSRADVWLMAGMGRKRRLADAWRTKMLQEVRLSQ